MNEPDLIGKRLDEYHILSQLGEGGMSTIFLALDTRLQRYTAIKVINVRLQNDPENVSRFNREAKAVARLDHPNIVRLYRYGQVEDTLYMSMQYIEGVDLRFLLQNYRQKGELIPPADAVRIVREICQALDYAHSNGVLHRDVKPSNIMLNRDGKAILTDFGLALIPDVETQGTAFGTPQYMAPEQAQSSADVGPKSDLYAVGMLIYEMFTGEIPFHEIKNPMEMVARRANTPPPPPSSIQPDINPDLEAVMLKALSLKPADRYQSGADLTAALEKTVPLSEIYEQLEEEESEAAVSPVSEEDVSAAEIMLPPTSRQIVSPPTAVPDPPPLEETNLVLASEEKRRGLPFPLVVGGCALLALLALLLIGGGIQLIRSQLQDRYKAWMPLTMEDGQDTPSSSEAYPASPEPTNPHPSEEEDGEEENGEEGENEQTNSEENRPLLRIVTNNEDSFYLINIGNSAVSLPAILFNDGTNVFGGSEWGISTLSPGNCVSIWKDRGNPRAPNIDCDEVGDRAELAPNETFWKKPFNIIFQNTIVTTCPESGCEFSVPGE